jgi:prefoldin subunit 5
MLASARQVKEKLERKRRNLGEAITRLHERIRNISTRLASVQVLLEAYTTAYHTVHRSRQKASLNVKVKRLEVRKARLDRMSIANNVSSLLKKQAGYYGLDRQVSLIDAYIASVQRRKVILNNAALHHAELQQFKRQSSNNTSIAAIDSALAFAGSFSAPAVIGAKQQTRKSTYSFGGHFRPMVMQWPPTLPVGV